MDQPPAVALTAFADAWPRARETEIGAALCAIGAGRTLTLTFLTPCSCFLFLQEFLLGQRTRVNPNPSSKGCISI